MKKLIEIFLSAIIAFFNNVGLVNPEKKPFTDNGYYEEEPGEAPDYNLMYRQNIANERVLKQSCNLDIKEVGSGRHTELLGDIIFPIALGDGETSQKYVEPKDKVTLNNDRWYLYKVPKGTEIVAPLTSTLDNHSVSGKHPYPEDDISEGIGLTIVTDANADGDYYKISFGSLECIWCCMSKDEPDDAFLGLNKPLYYHDHQFKEKYTFQQGMILGRAGNSGVPDSYISDDSAYVLIHIEKCNTLIGNVGESLNTFCGI